MLTPTNLLFLWVGVWVPKNEEVKSKLSKNLHSLTASMMASVNRLESNQIDFINNLKQFESVMFLLINSQVILPNMGKAICTNVFITAQ